MKKCSKNNRIRETVLTGLILLAGISFCINPSYGRYSNERSEDTVIRAEAVYVWELDGGSIEAVYPSDTEPDYSVTESNDQVTLVQNPSKEAPLILKLDYPQEAKEALITVKGGSFPKGFVYSVDGRTRLELTQAGNLMISDKVILMEIPESMLPVGETMELNVFFVKETEMIREEETGNVTSESEDQEDQAEDDGQDFSSGSGDQDGALEDREQNDSSGSSEQELPQEEEQQETIKTCIYKSVVRIQKKEEKDTDVVLQEIANPIISSGKSINWKMVSGYKVTPSDPKLQYLSFDTNEYTDIPITGSLTVKAKNESDGTYSITVTASEEKSPKAGTYRILAGQEMELDGKSYSIQSVEIPFFVVNENE